jgi:peptidoglycan/LPS O-acetylase OafA/YrhL
VAAHDVTMWQLGRRPALDGLRGVAILLVLVGHLGIPGVTSPGTYGVTVFFVLSGFLITTLLLEERQRDGAWSLPAFYGRRARRLLPAMVVCVALALAVDLALYGGVPDWLLVVGTLGYSANFVMGAGDWFPGTTLGHTWSLAVEEQFYLLWPLLLAGLVAVGLRRARLLVAAAVVVLAAWTAALHHAGAGFDRLYFGTDTRFAPLLMGCLLAFILHRARTRLASPAWQVYGWLLVIVACIPSLQAAELHLVWLPAVAGVGAVLLIYAAVNGRAHWLGWGPLAYVGRRSYALYLYQGVVLVVLRDQPWVPTPVYWVVVLPVLFGMAELSWRYVESPWLRTHETAPAEGAGAVHGVSSTGSAGGFHSGGGYPLSVEVLAAGSTNAVPTSPAQRTTSSVVSRP